MNSSGIDGISNRVLKLLGPSFIESLTYAINKSFKNKFSEILKTSKLTPFWKGNGDPQLPTYYRPIAQLPSMSKLLEKLACQQAKTYHQKNKIIGDNQFDFKEQYSTYDALILATDKLN